MLIPRQGVSRAALMMFAVLAGLAMLLVTAAPAQVSAAPIGGPVLLDGGDFPDHGSGNATTISGGWVYALKAVENIAPQVSRAGNDGSVALLGSSDSTSTSSQTGGNYHYVGIHLGKTIHYYEGAAAINGFFADLSTGTANPAIIVTAGTGSGNDLSSAEGAALSSNALAIADFVNSGGGLIGHGTGGTAFGWLNALIPGISFPGGCSSSSLSLTAAGIAAFPGLTNSHIRSGPCHGNFTGDFGGLQILAKDGSNRSIILGGANVQLPGSVEIDPPTATNLVGDPHTVTITVRDTSGVLVGETVTVVVSGVHSLTGSDVTNAAGQITFTYTGTVPGTDAITASYVDATGATRSATAEKIWELPPNVAPVAALADPGSVAEGSSITLDASGSTDADGDPLTFAWDLDNDGSYDDGTGATASFAGIDGPATHTVGVEVCDDSDVCDTASATVTVTNVDPTVDAGSDITVLRNEAVNLSGTFTDPAGAADDLYGWDWDVLASGSANYGDTLLASTSYALPGEHDLVLSVTDKDGGIGTDTVHVTVLNQAPVCDATASIGGLWPPNHKFRSVEIVGVTDADGDTVTITVTSIFQDEALDANGDGSTEPDGRGVGTDTAEVRAERAGGGNGRVYHISYSADDGYGGTCSGTVTLGVPHDQRKGGPAVDDGALFDSTGGI